MENKLLEKNIIKLYLITICQAFIFAYVVERLFAEERGLSVLEMQYLLILYSIISFMLEIPAGVLADLWKKKYTLALGNFFCFFEFFICIFSFNVFQFSFAYLAAAIGGSLKSGTIDSILYQTLQDLKREQDYVKLKGRLKFVKYLVSGIAGVSGGYIAQFYGYEMNYWLSLFSFPLGIYLSLTLYESKKLNKIKSVTAHLHSFIEHIKKGLVIFGKNRRLCKIIIVSGITGAVLYGELHEMSMLVYPELKISLKFFGYISLGITIVGALSGLVSSMLEKNLKSINYLIPLFVVSAGAIFCFGTIKEWCAVLFLIIAIGLLETMTPIFSGAIQDQAPDEIRVTISSIESFFFNAISSLVGLIFGYISNLLSVQHAFQILAFILLTVILVMPRNSRKLVQM